MNLRLTQDGKVLFDLVVPDLPHEHEESTRPISLDDREMRRLCAFYSMSANQKRLKVLMELAGGSELRFSDVMQIATNPKLAQDCLQPMLREGLVLHGGRGSGYRISERALPLVMTLTLGLAKLLAVLEQEIADTEESALR
jgi:hypothetical protein